MPYEFKHTPMTGGTYVIANSGQFWNAAKRAWADSKSATLYSWSERYETPDFIMPLGGAWWVIR